MSASPLAATSHREDNADAPNDTVSLAIAPWLREARPDTIAELEEAYRLAVSLTDSRLLELLALRIASLLGYPRTRAPWVSCASLPDAVIERLPSWPEDPLFTERERDCLSFTEGFVMDVAGITDTDAAVVRRHFDDRSFLALVTAIYLTEYTLRLQFVAERLAGAQ